MPVEHLVRFTTTEGRDAQHVAPSLDDALRFVERLRNNEETNEVRLYRLQEVPVAFKAYYRAEVRPADPPVAGLEPLGPPTAKQSDAKPVEASSPVPVAVAAPDVESPEQQARKLFSRG